MSGCKSQSSLIPHCFAFLYSSSSFPSFIPFLPYYIFRITIFHHLPPFLLFPPLRHASTSPSGHLFFHPFFSCFLPPLSPRLPSCQADDGKPLDEVCLTFASSPPQDDADDASPAPRKALLEARRRGDKEDVPGSRLCVSSVCPRGGRAEARLWGVQGEQEDLTCQSFMGLHLCILLLSFELCAAITATLPLNMFFF